MAYDATDIIKLVNRYFNAGDADLIVDLFASRFPVFTDAGVSLMSKRADTRVSVERLMAAAKRHGTVRLEHRILSVEPSPRGESSIVRVEWTYLGANGQPVATGDVKYYCGKDTDGIIRILMIEYLKTACPEAISEMPVAPWPKPIN